MSVTLCGWAMVRMLSCTTPTFSNTPRTERITQPDMARMRITSASPAAASPVDIAPSRHSISERVAMAASRAEFITASVPAEATITRPRSRKARVLRASASRTEARSSSDRANSFTVSALV